MGSLLAETAAEGNLYEILNLRSRPPVLVKLSWNFITAINSLKCVERYVYSMPFETIKSDYHCHTLSKSKSYSTDQDTKKLDLKVSLND